MKNKQHSLTYKVEAYGYLQRKRYFSRFQNQIILTLWRELYLIATNTWMINIIWAILDKILGRWYRNKATLDSGRRLWLLFLYFFTITKVLFLEGRLSTWALLPSNSDIFLIFLNLIWSSKSYVVQQRLYNGFCARYQVPLFCGKGKLF